MCLSSSSKRLFFQHILNIRQYHDITTLCTVQVIQQFCMCAYNRIQHNVQYNWVRAFRLLELTPSCDPSRLKQLIAWSRHLVTQLIFLNRTTQLVLPPSKWYLLLRSPHQNPVSTLSPIPYVSQVTLPHYPWFLTRKFREQCILWSCPPCRLLTVPYPAANLSNPHNCIHYVIQIFLNYPLLRLGNPGSFPANTRWFKYDRDWFVCKQV